MLESPQSLSNKDRIVPSFHQQTTGFVTYPSLPRKTHCLHDNRGHAGVMAADREEPSLKLIAVAAALRHIDDNIDAAKTWGTMQQQETELDTVAQLHGLSRQVGHGSSKSSTQHTGHTLRRLLSETVREHRKKSSFTVIDVFRNGSSILSKGFLRSLDDIQQAGKAGNDDELPVANATDDPSDTGGNDEKASLHETTSNKQTGDIDELIIDAETGNEMRNVGAAPNNVSEPESNRTLNHPFETSTADRSPAGTKRRR